MAFVGICALRVSALVIALLLGVSSYEIYLKLHQGFGIILAVCILHHMFLLPKLGKWPVFSCLFAIGMLNLGYGLYSLYRNKAWGTAWPRIVFEKQGSIIRAEIALARAFQAQPGQYINLWVPGIELLSSHPFTVASVQRISGISHIQLVIEPKHGMTRRLLRHVDTFGGGKQMLALFSGPHGRSRSHSKYHTVIMIASKLGIVPILAYLRDLLAKKTIQLSTTKRLGLIWVKGDTGK